MFTSNKLSRVLDQSDQVETMSSLSEVFKKQAPLGGGWPLALWRQRRAATRASNKRVVIPVYVLEIEK